MTFREFTHAIGGGVLSGPSDREVTGLAYDSRRVKEGTVFAALRGESVDGHDYIDKAIRAGAAGIIAERAPESEFNGWYHVGDSRAALAEAAAHFYGNPSREMKVCGITGTNGKTTTAFIVHHLATAALRIAGLIGTVHYDLGDRRVEASRTTPESLDLQEYLAEMRDAGCRAVAMEVSSHGLVQHRVRAVDFDVAVFTNLSQDHLDYHGDMDSYFAAKKILFEKVAAKENGKLIIHGDDRFGRRLVEEFKDHPGVTTYGFGQWSDFKVSEHRSRFDRTEFRLEARGRQFLVRIPLIGQFNVLNAAAALAAANGMGLNLREAVVNIANCPQVPGRLECVSGNSPFRVFVDYAHTPDAVENALRTVKSMNPGRVITVIGCGGDRDRGKRAPMGAAAEAGSDICILTSDNPRGEDPLAILEDMKKGFRGSRYAVEANRRKAIELALREAKPRDIILIAGKGHETYQEIAGVKHPFDDREAARIVLRQIHEDREGELDA